MPRPAPRAVRSALAELKQRNEWLVIDALRDSGLLTRAGLVDVTGLSRSTIGNVVVELQRRGIVDERQRSPRPASVPGRPGAAVTLRSAAGVAVGIAIDRECVRVAAVDVGNRPLAERWEGIPTGADGGMILTRVAELVRSLAGEIPIALERIVGIGIGLPGPVDLDLGGVDSTATLRRWAGLDVRGRLSQLLEGLHVMPDNDANFGALGELQYGAGRGVGNLIYVRIGPGIGGGLIIEGQLHRGDGGYAGEIGHITSVPDGKPCPCGRRGCLSTVASTWAIAEQLAPVHGPDLSVARILALAASGNPHARTALREAGTHIGRVLGALVNALNPGLVILGGELGAGSEHLLAATRGTLAQNVQPIAERRLRVVHAELAEHAEVLGATARVLRDERRMRAFVAGR